MLDLYAAAAAALEQDDDFLAISLGIEKAFDSVQWPFLYKVLKGFGFPQYFLNWIKILHNNKELRIFNNGHSSKPIQVSNGLAQGCALSPLLFVLCMESLASVIRNNDRIKGITVGTVTKKIGLVADDTVLIQKATTSGFQEVVKVLRDFHKVSGLKINYDKSVIVRLGKNYQKYYTMDSDCDFKWLKHGDSFHYLGAWLKVNEQGHLASDSNKNFELSEVQLMDAIRALQYARHTHLGKVLLIKSLWASRFVYKFSLLLVPQKVLNTLDRFYYRYLWNGGRHRVTKTTMELPLQKGGSTC